MYAAAIVYYIDGNVVFDFQFIRDGWKLLVGNFEQQVLNHSCFMMLTNAYNNYKPITAGLNNAYICECIVIFPLI